MKRIMLALAVLSCSSLLTANSPSKPPEEKLIPKHDCKKQGHIYGPWYKQETLMYLPGPFPAHICTICGSMQTDGGWLMQHVRREDVPGGLGKNSLEFLNQLFMSEIIRDFGSIEKYKAAPAKNLYRPDQ